MNDQIRVQLVRLIDQDKNQVGIVKTSEALQMASGANLDLVEIAPNVDPPVCRIMDYGKFVYDQQKKAKEAKKNQHKVKVKEIKLSPRTSDHDYEYRMKHAREFLEAGDRVKVTITFKGREMSHRERRYAVLDRFKEDLSDIAHAEREKDMQGRNMISIFVPGLK